MLVEDVEAVWSNDMLVLLLEYGLYEAIVYVELALKVKLTSIHVNPSAE